MKQILENSAGVEAAIKQVSGKANEVMTDKKVEETSNGTPDDSLCEKRIEENSEKELSKAEMRDMLNRADSFSRFPVLMNYCYHGIPKYVFAELLGEYWELCDNLFNYRHMAHIAFLTAEKYKDRVMTKEAYDLYQSLPEKVTIYRGMTVKESRQRKYSFGISWTLDRKVAEFFAYEYIRNFATQNEPKTVLEAIVDKKDIVAVFLRREESEVICLNVKRENIVKSKS